MLTYLVCYDIEDDRERTRLAHLLEGYGERVQYSVFELHLRRSTDLDHVKDQIRSILKDPEAEVRFYRLTADAIAASHRLDGSPLAARDLVVIV